MKRIVKRAIVVARFRAGVDTSQIVPPFGSTASEVLAAYQDHLVKVPITPYKICSVSSAFASTTPFGSTTVDSPENSISPS